VFFFVIQIDNFMSGLNDLFHYRHIQFLLQVLLFTGFFQEDTLS